MFTRLQMLRTIQVAAYAAVFAFSASGAEAAPKKSKGKASSGAGDFCASSWREGESLAKDGKLRQAMEWMLKCAQATCKAAIRKECTSRVSQIEADIPTVVPAVTDASGKGLSEVQVVMDGELLASRLDGRGIPVDPGEHEFAFKTDKGTLGSQKAVIPQGQRNVAVTLNLAGGGGPQTASAEGAAPAGGGEAAVATSSEEPRSKSSEAQSSGGPGIGTYALGVLGLAGVGGYGLLTYWGNKDNKLLEACSPDCKPESLDHIRKLYNAGRVSLGIGIAALAGATVLYLTSGSSSSTEVASSRSNFRLDVAPTASGGFAAFSGSF